MEEKKTAAIKSSSSLTAAINVPFHAMEFHFEHVSPQKVIGRLHLTQICCQYSHSRCYVEVYQRIADVHLSISHLKPAQLGDPVFAEATTLVLAKPFRCGRCKVWKIDPSNSKQILGIINSSSRVTFLFNLPMPEHEKDTSARIRKYAKL